MSNEEVYQKFIDYMNNPVFEFTESESKMPMITSFITPEEAEFLTGFPMSGKTLEEIAEIKQLDLSELEPKVKALCKDTSITKRHLKVDSTIRNLTIHKGDTYE
jgi:hypothetical protein